MLDQQRTLIRLFSCILSAANAFFFFMFFGLALNILLTDGSAENPYWLIALLRQQTVLRSISSH
jgi:hypothetical protein